jgi:hypothetical protein
MGRSCQWFIIRTFLIGSSHWTAQNLAIIACSSIVLLFFGLRIMFPQVFAIFVKFLFLLPMSSRNKSFLNFMHRQDRYIWGHLNLLLLKEQALGGFILTKIRLRKREKSPLNSQHRCHPCFVTIDVMNSTNNIIGFLTGTIAPWLQKVHSWFCIYTPFTENSLSEIHLSLKLSFVHNQEPKLRDNTTIAYPQPHDTRVR